jgi:hypothetical protein
MDIAAGLCGFGRGRYEAALRDNKIDLESLPKLPAEGIEDLGVVLGGHRRKLLEAIDALHDTADAAVARVSAAPAPERRQLTVML